MSVVPPKTPQATLPYGINWSDFLAGLGAGVTIAASEWTVPEGLTVVADSEDFDDTTTTIVLEGGEQNTDYTLYNKITTSTGHAEQRAIVIPVRDATMIAEVSDAETRLAAVRVALDRAVAKNAAEYSIANRMKKEHSLADLIALESRLIQQVNQERHTRAVRQGAPVLRNVHAQFRRPT